MTTGSQIESSDNTGNELRATYAGAKRRIAALEQQLQGLLDAGNKRKSYAIVFCFPSRYISPPSQ